MSKRGTDFLQTWIERNLTDENRNGSPVRAMTLADNCIAEAAKVGISAGDLDSAWGTIESIIYEAMLNDAETVPELSKAGAVARDKSQCNVK